MYIPVKVRTESIECMSGEINMFKRAVLKRFVFVSECVVGHLVRC